MGYLIINRIGNCLIIVIAVKAVVIIVTEVKNAADTVIKSTKINDNCITLTETRLIFFVSNIVLRNIKLKIVLIITL